MADIFEIAGRIHSTSQEHVTSPADEILDTSQNKKQHLINADVARHESEINSPTNGLNKRVADIEALGQIGDTPVETNASNIINNTSLNGKVPSASAVNGIYNAVAANAGYYACDSEASTAAKVVEASGYVLTIGGCIKIKMTNANTADDDATLNINSTGAKALYYEGERASATNSWEEGETVEVYYDGTNFYANNVAGGSGSGDGAFDVSAKYPTSGVEGGNTYTLEGALAVLNANLSASKKKDGMSIKFVQSSDHKYVQYRLMAASWSINTDDWAIADESVYVENPEFVYVKTDAEDKILWAIKKDGGIYYGAGVPQQVIDYIEKKIADLSLDEYEDIVAFLNDLEKGDKTLQTLLDEKVDKVEGKSLIDEDVADRVHYIEHPEFAEVKLDSEERILEATRLDGTKLFGADIKVNRNSNIGGNINVGGNANIIGDLSFNGADVTVIKNPEFVGVWLDNKERILFGIKVDGDAYFGIGCPKQVKKYVEEKIADLSLDEYEDIVAFLSDYLGSDTTLKVLIDRINAAKVDKVEGKSLIDAEYAEGVSQIENPEFAEVHTDADNKVLYGVKQDGDFYFGAGVPSQIQEELDNDLADLAETKVDKEEGKSLIDEEYASSQSAIENPEFLDITVDTEDKILEGIKSDGTKVIGGDLNIGGSTSIAEDIRVLGNMEVSGVSYKVIENTEYLAAWVDTEDKVLFGLKADGKTYVGDADFLNDIKNNQEAIAEIKTTLATIGVKVDSLDIDALSSITAVENPEYIKAEVDSENKLLAGRTPDGAAFENVGFSTPKVSIDGHIIKNTEDPETRSEIKTDGSNKIISYRDKNGVLHEEIGICPVSMIMPLDALEQAYEYNSKQIVPKRWYLPSFGKVIIKEETFYLTSNPGYSDKNGVALIQMYDDTDANANAHRVLSYYYVKSTLTPLAGGGYDRTSVNENSVMLDFYVRKDIKKVNGSYYVKSTLDGSTVVSESIEVTQIVDVPPYKAWPIDKTHEHYCTADIDFGSFCQATDAPISIKYQGNVSMGHRKRGLRITFYKANNYNKKKKVKIGEMLRLSGFNMKSFYYDSSRVKDPVLTNLIIDIWETKGKDAYPWNKDNVPYNGAIGMHKSFPIETYFGNEFFGLQMFGMKKDEKNYMLDGDEDSSGIFAQSNEHGDWNSSTSHAWDDEMGVKDRVLAYPDKEDSLSVESAAALDVLLKYIRGFINGTIYKDSNENVYDLSELTEVDEVLYVTSTLDNGNVVEGSISVTSSKFKKSMLEDRIDIEGMIDYYIVLETFLMWDNSYHNLILYSGSDKKKFYPFFYDVDNSFVSGGEYNKTLAEIMSNRGYDFSLWVKFVSEYKDNIINRYSILRKEVLTVEHLKSVYNGYVSGIPANVVTNEIQRWGKGNPSVFSNSIEWFEKRITWLDNNILDIVNLNN